MGDIIGGIIGGIGSLIGGNKTQQAQQQAQKADLTGFNYLTNSPIAKTYLPAGAQAVSQQANTIGAQSALLGGGTPEAQQAQKGAFQNYLGSTGYNFQRDEGMRAITGSAAAKGILNSGSTAKALQERGQQMALGGFNNYFGQLGQVSAQQGQVAQQGLQAGQIIGQAGTQGGVAAGNAATTAGGQAQSAITSAAGQFAGAANAGWTNYFGGI